MEIFCIEIIHVKKIRHIIRAMWKYFNMKFFTWCIWNYSSSTLSIVQVIGEVRKNHRLVGHAWIMSLASYCVFEREGGDEKEGRERRKVWVCVCVCVWGGGGGQSTCLPCTLSIVGMGCAHSCIAIPVNLFCSLRVHNLLLYCVYT